MSGILKNKIILSLYCVVVGSSTLWLDGKLQQVRDVVVAEEGPVLEADDVVDAGRVLVLLAGCWQSLSCRL